MATNVLNRVVRHLRQGAMQQAAAGMRDGELLEAYISRKDEGAFEALLRRHGAMVLGVCQRILRNNADAEDAFQATFLVLVRKARSIRSRGAIANWLYGVAHHTALKARIMNRRRRSKELAAGTVSRPQVAEEIRQQVQALLDSELAALRDIYRIPIVLCDLEGKTIKEAAAHLGWPQGTVATRLRRGRCLLARRLSRHGLPLSGAALLGTLSAGVGHAAVPPALLGATLRAAGMLGAGQALRVAGVSTQVATLTEGVMKAMLLSKLKSTTALVLIMALLGMGAAGISRCADPGDKEVRAVQNPGLNADTARKLAGPKAERLVISSQVSGVIVDVIRAGDKVRSGAVLVRLDHRAAKADLDRARAHLEASKADHAVAVESLAASTLQAERMKKLRELKAIDNATYDQAVLARDRMRSEVDAKLAFVRVAAADVEKARVVVAQHVLKSPVAGTIRTVFIEVGAVVKAGEPILEIDARQAVAPAKQRRAARDDLMKQIETLEADVAQLQDRAAWSDRMFKKGFISRSQVQADRRRLEQALTELDRARKQAGVPAGPHATSLEALAARFSYRVPIETGYTEFSRGGRLEILEVRGTRPKIEVGGQYLVHGKYAMPFHDEGTIYFHLTSEQWGKLEADFDLQRTAVKKGRGEFTLLHGMAGSGGFHIHLIARDGDRQVTIANVYFGTGDNVRHKRP
jgi:RNA polymerase sigma factor (sigma-70 family)